MPHNTRIMSAALAALLVASAAQAQVVNHPDDVTIAGDLLVNGTGLNDGNGNLYVNDETVLDDSVCIGNSCSNIAGGETFANDETLRFRYTALSIQFVDTSSAPNPNNDWTLRINDPSAPGIDKFAVEDDTAGTTPFTIEAGLPDHALYVESDGDVGFGTNNPAMDLHMVSTDTPTVRLDQSSAGGNPAQIWDIGSNETNFFVRDITGGTTLPLKILTGAPTDALVIDGDGMVGIGTSAPTASLHVIRSDGTARLRVEDTSAVASNTRTQLQLVNNGAAQMALIDTNTGADWRFQNLNGKFRITLAGTGSAEMDLDGSGNMVLRGSLTTTGSCSVGCDRVFAPDYALPSIEDHAALMWQNGHLPNVGPTAEQGQIDLTDKVLRMLNELEQAHIYIDQLNQRVEELEAMVAKDG